MRRYITLSAILHFLLFLLLWVPVLISTEAEPPSIRIDSVLPPPPQIDPEETVEATATPIPTPDQTQARSMVGEDLPTPTQTATPTPTKTLKPSPTPSPTATETKVKPSPTPTSTQAPATATPTKKPTEKATSTPKPTEKPTEKPTKTPKPTSTAEATSTPQATATPTIDKKKKALEEAAELAKQISLEEKEQPSQTSESSSASAASGASPDAGFINQGGGMKTNRDFNDRGYLIRLSQTLQQSFVPPLIPQGSGERVTTVLFKIHANGTISDMQVIKSSGHRRVDRSALQAVQTVAQFEPLPGGISDLEVSCDFKVD